ncbi:autophagy-related protein 2 isoform X2 [Pistacia vera]|uniref:autophagy-related protein 2 isoform X2 n=1 Tax=Pistacia vera TaxID=55513 RepID=UPI0012639E6C|nr:autophagy-related protein 2 isoform X2 [Pistacia vera]
MFSGWRFAKTAEEMVSKWAVKRVCKFFLKKKLGQFILGDIDLDQLDVQLSDGSIQLNDLALNVDFLNQKFGAATSVRIKEGSIGSLLVKMPWKDKGCQVEVDELEIVLAPCQDKYEFGAGDESCSTSQDGSRSMQWDSGQFGHDMGENVSKPSCGDVHEGVKMIANMVKWFLTSFHVRIKKLIVAYDPCLEKDENKVGSNVTLVFRISEIECGTCIAEDASLNGDASAENFLGISRLTNFVKFQGAVLELLRMDDVGQQTGSSCTSGMPFTDVVSNRSPSNVRTSIMTWKRGGFSGNIKLSIPWKNGSLDIRKVDVDVCVDPIELKFQPSTIKWFLVSWETYKKFDKDRRVHMIHKSSDSVYFNASSHFYSSPSVSSLVAPDKMVPIHGSYSSNLSSLNGQDSVTETTLPGSHLILDWVPHPVNKNQKDGIGEVDLGASVNQFFECFDGMRNSQSALGSSGMWNWTCSVFSAITAASNLASGTLQVPSEQQHVQTNLKAVFAGVYIVFSFHDEDEKQSYDGKGDQINVESHIHCLGAECRDISLVVQVCPQETRVDGTVKKIDVADYFHNDTDVMNFHLREGGKYIDSQTVSVQHLQDEVLGALPPFAPSAKVHDMDESIGIIDADVPFGNKDDVVKISLLRTSGITHCQCTMSTNPSHASLAGSALFSLKLPPFIFWVNFHLINMLWDLYNEVVSSLEMTDRKNGSCEVVDEKHRSSHGDVKKGSCPPVTTMSATESFHGDISIPDARVILCFPFNGGKDIGGYFSWNQFIALDFSSPSTFNKGVVQHPCANLEGTSQKRFSSTAIRSLNLNVGDLDIYMVSSTFKDDVGINSCSTQGKKMFAHNILSVSNRTGRLSVISMLWQDGPVTGPWIAKRAKFLATFEEDRSRNKFRGKGCEFATVNTLKDLEDRYSRTREEIVLSSAFFLHVRVFPLAINLDSSQYRGLHELLNQIISGLSCVAHDKIGSSGESSGCQTSVIVECDSVELLIEPDIKENIKGSMQSELPGSWNSLKLRIQKFSLLSVSNIGGIKDASFFWLAHGEGSLCGSVTGVPSQELRLISCSNSSMKRGDGGGSNALSSRLAGSDIIYLLEPETSHGFTSVTVRCSTIVAVGGRLDWLDAIISFFSLPSLEIEEAGDNSLQKGDLIVPSKASFVLNLIDVGLSYEPYFINLMVHSNALDSELGSTKLNEETDIQYVACLLAASSLVLSNTTVANSMDNDYRIRVQDLGLLLCAVLEPKKLGGTYSAQHLHEIGYVKVAQEALLEAVLRTNSLNSLLWELECSKSHVNVDTCHDTTSGLIQLATQLQQLFAPDMEESLVHLQNRYNNVQQAQEGNDFIDDNRILNSDCASSTSQMNILTADANTKSGSAGLMDEISEDAFHLDGNQTCQFDCTGSQFPILFDDALLREACSLSVETPENISSDLSVNGSTPLLGLENSQTSSLQTGCYPEFIEGYCLADLRSLSELPLGRQSSPQNFKRRPRNVRDEDLGKGNCGWYGDAHFRIVENHLSEASVQTTVKQALEGKLSAFESAGSDDFGKAFGRVLFKNINISWRMYAGSDWHESRTNGEDTTSTHGRDMTVCLELALSGMQFQYDIFPIGGMSVSKLSLSVQDFRLYDKSRDAPWKLVLGYYESKDHPRESASKAFRLDLEAVRPNPLTPLEEYRLRVAILPMLLHLHQCQLDFLIDFFQAKSPSVVKSPACHKDSCDSSLLATRRKNLAGHTIADEALLPYFQKFDIWPLLVRVDYSPSRVDLAALRGGKYVELVNLVPWKGVELQLKDVHAVGIYGWGSVCETILGEWLEEISQNQIHKLLRGLPPVRSLVAVGSGAAKLVSLPFENYRKDRRVLKGMQRGTIAFLRSISLEAVGLGVHLAAGAHDILLQAECILMSVPPSVSCPVQDKTKTNVRCNQPKDAHQGIQQAYESFSDGLGRSASALIQQPLKKYQRGASAGSALATVVRGVPAAAIAPASACASAVHYALLGIRNSLDPEHKRESMEKYLGPTQPRERN